VTSNELLIDCERISDTGADGSSALPGDTNGGTAAAVHEAHLEQRKEPG